MMNRFPPRHWFSSSLLPRYTLRSLVLLLGGGLCAALPALAGGNTEPLTDILPATGAAGLGVVTRIERSPYKDAGTRYDLLPLYLYEGERLFLHANRGGVKLLNGDERRLDLFVEQRLEGFPTERLPASLAGMATLARISSAVSQTVRTMPSSSAWPGTWSPSSPQNAKRK